MSSILTLLFGGGHVILLILSSWLTLIDWLLAGYDTFSRADRQVDGG